MVKNNNEKSLNDPSLLEEIMIFKVDVCLQMKVKKLE